MTRFKKAAIAIASLILLAAPAFGQGAQFTAGSVWGNDTAATRPGKVSTVTAILDRALGSTRGAILERGVSGWAIVGPGATSGLPWVSNGIGADPVYQRLGLVGGGTGLDMTATGGVGRFVKQNSAGGALTVVQPAFTDMTGRGTLAQLPQGIANSIWINPTGSTADMQNVAVPACANDGAHGLVYVNGSGLACATLTTGGTVTSVAGAGLAVASPAPIIASGTITVTAATKSDQQTGSSATVAVTPLHQQDHDSGAKAWVNFTGRGSAGGATINAGYNVTSITRTATTGIYTVAFTTAFASASYVCNVTTQDPTNIAPLAGIFDTTAPTASAITVYFENAGATAGADPQRGHVVCYGRQ